MGPIRSLFGGGDGGGQQAADASRYLPPVTAPAPPPPTPTRANAQVGAAGAAARGGLRGLASTIAGGRAGSAPAPTAMKTLLGQ